MSPAPVPTRYALSPIRSLSHSCHQHLRRGMMQDLSKSFSTTPVNQSGSLAGTIVSHTSYVLLHSRVPPTEFPSKVPSRLQRSLQLHASQWGGVINFSWSPEQSVHPDTRDAEWEFEEETYSLTAFSRFRGMMEIPEVSSLNLEEVQEQLRLHGSPPGLEHSHGHPALNSSQMEDRKGAIHIYVCTHRNRDCRCGDSGVSVFEALRSEVDSRQLSDRVKVGGVSHVGGHK